MSNDTNPKDLEGNKKPPLSLVPSTALIYMAQAFKEGAAKYGAYNWRSKKVQAMIYLDAALRHISAKIDGEDIDPESGKDHLAGALASLAVYVDAQETGNLIDNRPAKGKAGQMIRKIGGKGAIDEAVLTQMSDLRSSMHARMSPCYCRCDNINGTVDICEECRKLGSVMAAPSNIGRNL